MDISSLKDYIIENDLIITVLESIGCHNIRDRGAYISSCNPDGDNPGAISVYKDTLYTIDYTRDIAHSKSQSDIFDLVTFFQGGSFFDSVKAVCASIGITPYHDFMSELPESLQITQLLTSMIQSDGDETDDDRPLKPRPEKILSYFDMCAVKPFVDDGILPEVQMDMEIGYDQLTNRITIPIRDVYGTLVGVKGRYFDKDTPDGLNKYVYLEHCNRSQVLYGLYRALPYIKRQKRCFVVESEKGVLQGMSFGVDNIVASGGKKLSNCQIEMLSRLCVEIVFCFDQDVLQDELCEIANRFVGDVNVSAMIDKHKILSEKESPTDNEEKFFKLLDDGLVVLRTGDSL